MMKFQEMNEEHNYNMRSAEVEEEEEEKDEVERGETTTVLEGTYSDIFRGLFSYEFGHIVCILSYFNKNSFS